MFVNLNKGPEAIGPCLKRRVLNALTTLKTDVAQWTGVGLFFNANS